MIHTDYAIGALEVLLNADCLSERYAPLIAYKDRLLAELSHLGCRTKSDAEKLSDGALTGIGLPDEQTVRLFRRFLTIYETNEQKLREIPKVTSDPQEQAAFRELYHLPGVKAVRATLYYRSGYRSVADFTHTSVEEVRTRTAATIAEYGMDCIVPLPKEIRTHIAVAQALTWEE